MAPTGLVSYQVVMTHATLEDPVETVTISVPYGDVSLVGWHLPSQPTELVGTCSMRKEGM